MRRGLIAAMEQEELDIVKLNLTPIDTVEDNANVAEILTIEQDLATQEKIIENTSDVANALEAIANAVEQSIPNGGLSKVNMYVVNTSIECLLDSVDISYRENYSLESFDNENFRQGATQLALEGIVSFAKKVIEKLIELVKRAIAWVSSFFKNMFTKVKDIKEDSEKIKKSINDIPDGDDEKKTVENPTLGKALIVNGAFPKDVSKSLDDLNLFFGKCAKLSLDNVPIFSKYRDQLFKVSSTMTRVDVVGSDSVLKGFTKLPDNTGNMAEVTEPSRFGLSKDGLSEDISIKASEGIIGGVNLIKLAVNKELEGQKTIDVLSQSKFILAHDKKIDEVTIDNIPVMTKAEIIDLTNKVTAICDSVEKFKQAQEVINKFKKELESDLEKINKAHLDSDSRTLINNVKSMSKYFINNLDQPIVSLTSHIVKTSRSLLDYCALSTKLRSSPAK